MLKRLELVGFKSFADKTRFDFSPGITAVVGPNGSGKSNVVDAVRWILGEQSAKSLRGGEMADVIFNGSSSRKSLGMAEVTVAFDNTRRLLAVDADEVQLTRRVYRDGTGEYLINGHMSRLRDIKDIFLGSGAGSGGYTIIAQGRVDELLQASTKDRREIFDEAAGISRFKAKKLEALRKLVAVENNLTRSKDRLDGLENQLRTLRMQASKAQKFKEYSDRLRELRIWLSLREFRDFTATLAAEEHALAALKAEVADATSKAEALEKTARELDWEVGKGEESLRHQESKLAEARQLIAGFEATTKHERASTASHESDALRLGRQRAELGIRLKALETETASAAHDASAAEERVRNEQTAADNAAAELAATAARVAELDRQIQADRERQFELGQRSAAARSLATSSLAQVERLQKEYTRKRGEIEQSSARRGALEKALDGLSRADADVQARLAEARERLVELHASRDELHDTADGVQQSLEGLRVRQGDLRGRIEVLEKLERDLEGLGAGVRHVLERMKDEGGRMNQSDGSDSSFRLHPSSFSPVAGLVADLLTVPRDVAPLVELALGDAAQRFVVREASQVDAVAAAVGDVTGRVGFLPVLASAIRPTSLASFVSCEIPSLPFQLLGNVFVADTLADARRLAASHPECRYVTRTGELLEPDGTLTVGQPTAGTGLVSRKSELRDLRDQFRTLSGEVSEAEVRLTDLRRRADAVEGVTEAVEAEIGMLSDEVGDLQQKIAVQREQAHQLEELVSLLRSESRVLEEEVRRGESAWLAAKMEAEETEESAARLTAELDDARREILAAEQDRDRSQASHTASQVSLGRASADRDRARDRLAQFENELRKKKIDAVDVGSQLAAAQGRLADSVLATLRASAGMAEAYREKESRERQVGEFAAKVAADRAARERVRDELTALRSGWQEKQTAAHERELAARDLAARRAAVADRIREDYGVELASLGQETGDRRQETGDTEQPKDATPGAGGSELSPVPCLLSPHQAQLEVEDLKRKLARLGSVNMEALDELARVEGEAAALKAQHDDLAASRASLQEIIDAINTDSRKLFTDTLAAVRGYFQELFRKLFGGGQADIVLEDPSDVLESGIEITARPPGKELRALSLLSGGEKTLTAVALLLAIFRNKPSPFCILDEVDAALDEANTTRLAGVLREFLDRSQFIVVTHKKRTMAAADRLWGVTMQESGISRLLAMRFEDWPDDSPEQAA
ncbi:MAG TPA: chromosome segregation protein SMC [Gemmataceae bacterium]|nr:chromosome segregation protein SMC [Gemmataceae bacterium]